MNDLINNLLDARVIQIKRDSQYYFKHYKVSCLQDAQSFGYFCLGFIYTDLQDLYLSLFEKLYGRSLLNEEINDEFEQYWKKFMDEESYDILKNATTDNS